MKLKNFLLMVMILIFLGGPVSCGKKGPPVPPMNTDKQEK